MRPSPLFRFLLCSGLGCVLASAQNLPTKLLECEGGQCVPGGGGPGNWAFNGRQGHAEWPRSGAVANLVIERFDFDGIVIRRVDFAGRTPGITAVYTGKILDNRIDGNVTWSWPGHWNKSPSSTWYATILQPAGYTFLDPKVPCNPLLFQGSGAEAAARGVQAIDGKNQELGVCWLRVGANKGDATAEGMLASALYLGIMGVPTDYTQAMLWAKRAAGQGNYLGERCLSRIYENGRGAAKNPRLAEYWRTRAESDKSAALLVEQKTQEQRKQQQLQFQQMQAQQTQQSQQQFRQNMAGLLMLGLLFEAMASDSGGDESNHRTDPLDRYNALKSQCSEGFTSSCNLIGAKPPNESH